MAGACTASQIQSALRAVVDPQKAEFLPRFFKTGPGEYGEGDRFLGVVVPQQRKIAGRFRQLPLPQVAVLLKSAYHEDRLTGLFILVRQFEKSGTAQRQAIFDLYVKHMRRVNNWDLVDGSAPQIVGGWLAGCDKALLDEWALSDHLWTRRIAIMATYYEIKQNRYTDTLRIAARLLHDPHDLIHKAVGWMLREVGKRDLETEERFLRRHCAIMPRTMLRYAIEKFPAEKRRAYMNQAGRPRPK